MLDFPPGANLETPADPAKWLRRSTRGLRATYRAQDRLLQAIGRNRLFCLLQHLGRDDRFGLWLYFASHVPSPLSLSQNWRRRNNFSAKDCVLSRLRNLYYNSNIQGTTATRTPLAGGYARGFSPKVDVRGDGMGTNRAVNLAQCTILNECFHNLASVNPTKNSEQWLCQNRKDF